MNKKQLKEYLDKKVDLYNQPSFIAADPISIPHLFTKKQDIEIAGFFAAIFAWGNRTTIINKAKELMQLMDMAPYEFISNHKEKDLKRLLGFKHRTFNDTDLLYFVGFFRYHYEKHKSLETAFASNLLPFYNGERGNPLLMETVLKNFYGYFFSLEDIPERTRKHIATPERNSTCKRLNMFLRWMVRSDKRGVDFGIWKNISPAQLICPLDVHVARVARQLGILKRNQNDWETALELTGYLRTLDKDDPVKYDFALFGLGAIEPTLLGIN
jgi:uncharacterized protein (TIGR02757 family)